MYGRTAYNFEAAVTSLFEDGAGDEPFRCLRASAEREVWSCLCDEGKSETSWERVSKHKTSRWDKETNRKRRNAQGHTHFEPLALVLSNDLNHGLRKLDDIWKDDLSVKFGMADAAREDEPYQTDGGFDTRQGLVFLSVGGS